MLSLHPYKQVGMLIKKLNKCYKFRAALSSIAGVFFKLFSVAIKKSLVWLSRCLLLTLKKCHLFLCWQCQEGMSVHIISSVDWALGFSSWCLAASLLLSHLLPYCTLAICPGFLDMWCLGWSYSSGCFSGVQAAQTNFCCCVGVLLCCGNVHFMGHRLCMHSPEIQGWNFCEFPELVIVSCCLLFHWHAAFQALCVSKLNKKLSLMCARGFAVVLCSCYWLYSLSVAALESY